MIQHTDMTALPQWAVSKQHKRTAAWWHVRDAGSEAEARAIARELNRNKSEWTHRPYIVWQPKQAGG